MSGRNLRRLFVNIVFILLYIPSNILIRLVHNEYHNRTFNLIIDYAKCIII